ncbi:MAG: hypothetical protein GYB68_12635, partial [Chloroflexi bacterium]|nr:hypothetical protein [Chloroflexota bacterium]
MSDNRLTQPKAIFALLGLILAALACNAQAVESAPTSAISPIPPTPTLIDVGTP